MAFMTEWFWFFLLLPAAALSGWVIGRRGGERHSDTQVSRLSTTHFRGLNYLLSEQPDKAIELFLHIAELDKDTFETQIALGHLFRRRGEVDRAIRLHQGLVQRNDLSDQQRVQALLALGEDYMKSGLLDRAETVFTELAQLDQRAPQALKHLISIYQSERDWAKAIENATRYEAATGEPMGRLIAHFECELAERQLSTGDIDGARESARRAYAADSKSVRAGILEGRVEIDAGNDVAAIRALDRAAGRRAGAGGGGAGAPYASATLPSGSGPPATSGARESQRGAPTPRPGSRRARAPAGGGWRSTPPPPPPPPARSSAPPATTPT